MSAFSDSERDEAGKSGPVWFALAEDRPLAFFAGIWTNWTSVRKLKEGEVTTDLYGFLTTDPNPEVGAVHPKAMAAIFTHPDEFEAWLTASWAEASWLQRPMLDSALKIVASGAKVDEHTNTLTGAIKGKLIVKAIGFCLTCLSIIATAAALAQAPVPGTAERATLEV